MREKLKELQANIIQWKKEEGIGIILDSRLDQLQYFNNLILAAFEAEDKRKDS